MKRYIREYEYLSKEFLDKMEEKTPPFTELGEFVRLRTYSRFINQMGRRETWLETVARVTNYSVSLVKEAKPDYDDEKLKEEAEYMFEKMYMLETFASGRSLWIGGTSVSKTNPLANFNCSFTTIESFEDFKEIFLLSMLGTGIGIRVLKEDVEKLPRVRNNVKVLHKDYKPVAKKDRKEYSELSFEQNVAFLTIGDSKMGWAKSISLFFDLISDSVYADIDTILINYDNVRPKGEKLKNFGGRASGHTSMLRMFKKIAKVINNTEGGKLKTIDVLDICNIIGENVVSGGVRRTAEIILFDVDDKDILNAKSNLYIQDDNGNWTSNEEILHRRMSNNSVFFNSKPDRKTLHEIINSIRYSGEPGFINAEGARKRREDFEGVNPCGEILLANKAVCNLTTTNLMAFVNKGKLKMKDLEDTIKLSVRIGLRMTIPHLEMEKWDKVHQRDRLLGVSFTGYQDMVNSTNLSMDYQRKLLRHLRKVAKDEANRYADELGLNKPKLVTTIKPEGTISTLNTTSSGIHFSHSPYYIRRVRITSTDPLLKVVEELGYPTFPEVGQTEENCDTKVVEFPIKAPMGKCKMDVGAIEQLEIYKMTMEEWTDHNTSITVTVRENEWEEVEEWIWNNWDSVIGISLLSLDDNFYPLLPYEEISEEEYNMRKSKMKKFDQSLLEKYEKDDEENEILEDGCVNGVCPIR